MGVRVKCKSSADGVLDPAMCNMELMLTQERELCLYVGRPFEPFKSPKLELLSI